MSLYRRPIAYTADQCEEMARACRDLEQCAVKWKMRRYWKNAREAWEEEARDIRRQLLPPWRRLARDLVNAAGLLIGLLFFVWILHFAHI